MPAKPESALYRRLRDNLSASDCHLTRIESRVGLGIPDCLVAFKRSGEFVMVELKVVKRGFKVNLSPHQVAFHLKHADMHCPTFVVVQYSPAGKTAAGELLVYSGDQVMDVHKLGVKAEPLARWPWLGVQWQMVKQVLLTGQPIDG